MGSLKLLLQMRKLRSICKNTVACGQKWILNMQKNISLNEVNMKFCLKQRSITNPPPTERIEKVSGVTEYEALRAEKLFRYEYSNQLNTSLLTFAFTVFTAGLVLFSLVVEFGNINNRSQMIELFIEYFFAIFFLLPCFFARINFKYTLNNSLRICQITDYVREKIKFDDDESWESFKQDYKSHYFYKQNNRIGGAKDIPCGVSVVSCVLSFLIFGIFTFLQIHPIELYLDQDFYLVLYWGIRLLLFIGTTIYVQKSRFEIKRILYLGILITNVLLTGMFLSLEIVDFSDCFFMGIIWAEAFHFCIFSIPQYNREIKIAELILDYTKAKLHYSVLRPKCNKCKVKEREIIIFNMFLRDSSFINSYISKNKKKKTKEILKYLIPYIQEMIFDKDEELQNEMIQQLNTYITKGY